LLFSGFARAFPTQECMKYNSQVFSPVFWDVGTLDTTTGHHNITVILLKVVLNILNKGFLHLDFI
jgi:hypothetical protein